MKDAIWVEARKLRRELIQFFVERDFAISRIEAEVILAPSVDHGRMKIHGAKRSVIEKRIDKPLIGRVFAVGNPTPFHFTLR